MPATYPSSAPAPVIERTDGSFRPPPAPVLPVKQGPAPLAYIVEAGGTVRVVEMDTGMTIASGDVGPQSIVSVDEKAGVRIGGQVVGKGPLPSDKTYQIFLETPNESKMSTEQIRPGAPQKAR